MRNMLRMDLYRMSKSRYVRVCLLLALLFGLAQTPAKLALEGIARAFASGANLSGIKPITQITLSSIFYDPFCIFNLNALLAMLAVCSFFYADQEYGYIKNIAGQMPRRGYTVLSKFLASIPLNVMIVAAGIIGNLLGSVILRPVVADADVMASIGNCLLKLLLLQSVCSILLLVTACFRGKAFGTALSVLFATGAMSLVYEAVNSGLSQAIKGFNIRDFMPDALMTNPTPTVNALLSAVISTALFLTLSIRIFDKKDVK